MPEKEFAEYIFKKKIRLDNSSKGTEETAREIAKWISAMMNGSGGLILLYCKIPYSDKIRDKWINGFNTLLKNWIPESDLALLVRYQNVDKDGQLRIYMFVTQSPFLVTYNFCAFRRHRASVVPITDLHAVQKMLKESTHSSANAGECSSQMANILTEGDTFKLNVIIPLEFRESETMEFKHFYRCENSKRKQELPSFDVEILKNRLGEHSKNFSAFANTHGGSLVFGVEERGKYPTVRGFPVTQNQEADEDRITQYLAERLGKCTWHSDTEYKPVKGQDWDVFYHKVLEEDGRERRMIEVRIMKHHGGMFMQPPVYYVLDGNGDLEEKKNYTEWKMNLQSNTSDMGNRDNLRSLEKHVDRAEPEIDEQEDQNSVASDEQLTEPTAAAAKSEQSKSFKESVSEHKSGITVLVLKLHDCCKVEMAEHIQTYTGDSFEYTREQLPDVVWSKKLMTFLQAKVGNGVVGVLQIAKSHNTTDERCLLPSGNTMLCHVVAIREDEPPLLMCCIHNDSDWEITKQNTEMLADYALNSGCSLKRQFLMSTAKKQHQSCLFHFDVEVLLVPIEGDVRTVWNSKNEQSVNYPNTNTKVQNTIACTGLASELLKITASLKNRYGQVLIDHLTVAQAKVLHGKPERVLLVNGKSGTGKTVIALHLMLKAKEKGSVKEDVIYVCSNEGLKAFVESSPVQCQTLVMKITNSLTPAEKNMLKKAKLLIVDDAQAIELDKQWETNRNDLYWMLFTHAGRPDTRVTVLFDAEQDYMENLPPDFATRLRSLAEKTLRPDEIKIPAPLTERIRNGQEIIRFMQTVQNQAKTTEKLECLSERPGDDVIYEYIGRNIGVSGRKMNDKINDLLKRYEARSIAILGDDTDQVNEMKNFLTEYFNKEFQEDNKYPIEHIVMCNLNDFGGLEADVVLFLLPRNFGTGEKNVHWKYLNVISSRARERLEFPLAWDPGSDRREGRLTDLLELFKTVRAIKYICVVATKCALYIGGGKGGDGRNKSRLLDPNVYWENFTAVH